MPKPKLVNLDALIQRADLLVPKTSSQLPASQSEQSIYLNMLLTGAPYSGSLRKPDFQRETSSWTPSQIATLVNNHLVLGTPSIDSPLAAVRAWIVSQEEK